MRLTLLDGRAQPTGLKQRGQDATLLIVLNAYHDVVKFTLPDYEDATLWHQALDTNLLEVDGKDAPQFATGHEYEVTGRSLLVFSLQKQ